MMKPSDAGALPQELVDTSLLRLNPLLRHQDFDDASTQTKTLIEIPDRHGRIKRMTLPKLVFELIQTFDGRISLAEFKQKYKADTRIQLSWEEFEKFIREQLLDKKVLLLQGDTEQFHRDLADRPSYMAYKKTIFGPRIVNNCARIFAVLYSRLCVSAALPLIILAQIYFYLSLNPHYVPPALGYTSGELILGVLLSVLGLLFHELGHASAAYRGGCRRVEIGVGWYVYFLVFFADLSEAWRLSRRQRAIIDAGGMYFQTIYIAALAALYIYTQSYAVFCALILLNLSLLWNLNPFFRLDGYWIASDLLGIANLRTASNQAFALLLSKFTGNGSVVSLASSVKPRNLLFLLLYTLASNVFFVWIVYIICTNLLLSSFRALPRGFAQLSELARYDASLGDWLVGFSRIIWQLLFLYFLLYFLWQNGKRMWALIQSRRTHAISTTTQKGDLAANTGDSR